MATGGYVPLSVNGIKGELSEVDSMPVALIGLPLIVQALENPESLDGMCKGNPRAERGLQFVALDPQPDRAVGRAVIRFPVNPLLHALQRFPRLLCLFPLLARLLAFVDCLTFGNHARQIVGQGQARRKAKNSA